MRHMGTNVNSDLRQDVQLNTNGARLSVVTMTSTLKQGRAGDRVATWGVRALLVLSLVAGDLSPTVQAQEAGLDSWFPSLRVGMWVKVEGVLTSDRSLEASRIKLYAGDLDEVEVVSEVTAVDLVRTTVQTAVGVRVVATPNTEMEGPKHRRHVSLAFLGAGDGVKIEGQLQKDGSLLAEEIDMDKPSRQPDAHSLTARIESIDSTAHRIVLLGVPVHLTRGTRIRSPLPD